MSSGSWGVGDRVVCDGEVGVIYSFNNGTVDILIDDGYHIHAPVSKIISFEDSKKRGYIMVAVGASIALFCVWKFGGSK